MVAALAKRAPRGPDMRETRQPGRAITGCSAIALAGLGGFFLKVLVANDSDNAYSWLAITGFFLVVASAPFALATLLPYGTARRLVVRVSEVLLGIVGALSGLLLTLALVVIPFQDYSYDGRVFPYHIVGFLVFALAIPAIFLLVTGSGGKLARRVTARRQDRG